MMRWEEVTEMCLSRDELFAAFFSSTVELNGVSRQCLVEMCQTYGSLQHLIKNTSRNCA